jgi:hypothetical protein
MSRMPCDMRRIGANAGLSLSFVSLRLFSAISSLALFAACASAVKPLDVRGVQFAVQTSESGGKSAAIEPGVAVIRFVESSVRPESGDRSDCKVRLSAEAGRGKAFEIPFSEGGKTFAVPPGRYVLSSAGCRSSQREPSPLGDALPRAGFEVRPGQLGYLGSFGGDSESADAVAGEIRWLQIYRMQIPAATREVFVSLWSGALLSEELLDEAVERPYEPLAQLTSGRSFDAGPLAKAVSGCRREEVAVNPVRLGRVHLTVHYAEDSAEPFVHEVRTAHTYTRSFIQCLQQALKDYRPDSGGMDVLSLEL